MRAVIHLRLIPYLAMFCSLMVGCPDPEKSFDDYLAREEALPDAPDMGATSGRCDDDLDATGLYLVS